MFGIEKDFQKLMEQVYGPLNKDKMTEIEKTEGEIKVLQAKLELLKAIEKHKTPVEEAYKDWMGVYPPTNPSVDNIFDIRWRAFQMGYNAAYEEKVSEWEPTPQTPEQTEQGLKEAFREAVKQGVVSSSNKPQTLYDLIAEWWEYLEDTLDMDSSIKDLVNDIKEWLPKEQSAAGSQNAYVESAVEGFNDAINKIRRKLR